MNYKKLKISAVFLLLGLGGLYAQEAVTATGGEASGSGGTVSYSVGQVVYSTTAGTNGSVAPGVQQPYEIAIITGIEVTEINLELSAYPNPTTDFLNIKIGNYDHEKLWYQLYDMQGKLLENRKIVKSGATIKMESLPASTYFLKVTGKQKSVKTFKIIKN